MDDILPLLPQQIYAYIFENIKTIQLEALLLSVLSITILVLVKELNEKFKRKIKMVLPIDLVLVSKHKIRVYSAAGTSVLANQFLTFFPTTFQEFLAHGLSNVIPSFFFCIPSAAAMGRTALLFSTGAKTQVACLISCILVLVVIYAIGPMLYWLPMCVLASIIVVGLKGMLVQFRDLKKYWNVDKIDWSIWVSTYVFTICFAANVGLLYGVVCTILIVVFRFPRATTLSLKQMKEAEYRYKTETDNQEGNVNRTHCSIQYPMEIAMIYTDSKKRNIDVLLANCKASLIKALKLSGRLESDNAIFFESVSSAIGAIHFNRNAEDRANPRQFDAQANE
ncbi:hypothetical protein JD844_015975 [Phrynosoma platyrhinos]|uniref:SLC26A/SulP transporter domain-containing protein n=1 Tax=Phrynosoma platyrhinos TaxID=52577 RepID=A0ABQ7SJP5_PHRPL|nr:hypothetical protein JD844_015975 [Phrynosoma platyrhinos]